MPLVGEPRYVIPTKGRVGQVEALRLFPQATLCVGESEAEAYAKEYPGVPVVTHPDDVVGIGRLRNWVRDHWDDEVLLQIDDDVNALISIGEGYVQNYGPEDADTLVRVTAQCAKDAGATVFGWGGSTDLKHYSPMDPFSFNRRCDGVLGTIGKSHRWDDKLLLREDVDLFLKALLKDRIVWADLRFAFLHPRFVKPGGNAWCRSVEQDEYEVNRLKARWGKYLTFKKSKNGTWQPSYHVPR